MSQMGSFSSGGGGGDGILTLTGNTGGAIPGDLSRNINVVGSGSVVVTGDSGSNTLTISSGGSTTYVATTPYTVLNSDNTLLLDTNLVAAAMTVRLPNAPTIDGRSWTIKDYTGAAATYNITVTTVSGTDTIDGATTFVLSKNYESITVTWSLSKATYSIVSGFDEGGVGITTIDGDVSFATGSTITLTGGTSGAVFTGDGMSTITESFDFLSLPATDSMGNGTIKVDGNVAFQLLGTENTFVGEDSGNLAFNTSTCLSNAGVGYHSLIAIDLGGSFNTAIGANSGVTVVNGTYNSFIGYNSGNQFTGGESNNICINSVGANNDFNTLRIGAATGSGNQQLNKAYICGIAGVNVGSVATVVTESSNQLGTAVITAGAGITVTPTANAITIAATGAISSTTYVNSTPYVVQPTDHILLVDIGFILGPVVIQLPDSPTDDGRTWTINDWTGQCNVSSTITVTTVSGSTSINGQSSYVMANNYESVTVVWSSGQGTYSIIDDTYPPIIKMPDCTVTTGQIVVAGVPVFQTFGTNNIFAGPSAGNFTLTGTDNVGVGQSCMTNISTDSFTVGIGSSCLSQINGGTNNVGVGYGALSSSISDTDNVGIGHTAGAALNGGSSNVFVGSQTSPSLTSGSNNVIIGKSSGSGYLSSESSNIMINNLGVNGESNTLRIGAATGAGAGELAAAFICGIDGVDVGSVATVVTENADQLGTAVLTAGSGISITPGSNTITIAATGSSSTSTTLVASTPYTVLTSDDVILVDTVAIGTASTILLLNAPSTDGYRLTIKDATGSAATNTITVQSVSGAVNIDLSTSFVMNTSLESITVVWSASQTQYYVI